MTKFAAGAAVQATKGTPVVPTAPLPGLTAVSPEPDITSNVPAYATNSAVQETDVEVIYRAGRLGLEGRLTNVNAVPFLSSALGAGASGVYKLGVGGQKFLTVKGASPNIAEYWQWQDMLINTWTISFETGGPLVFTAALVGPDGAVTAAAWTAVAPNPTIYGNWQVMSTFGGAVACVRRFRISGDNHLTPIYCSIGALPGVSTLAGLTPDRYASDDPGQTVRVEAVLQYTGEAASQLHVLTTQGETAWLINAASPDGATTLDLEMTRVKYLTAPPREYAGAVWETVTGAALLDTTPGTALTATVTG